MDQQDKSIRILVSMHYAALDDPQLALLRPDLIEIDDGFEIGGNSSRSHDRRTMGFDDVLPRRGDPGVREQ